MPSIEAATSETLAPTSNDVAAMEGAGGGGSVDSLLSSCLMRQLSLIEAISESPEERIVSADPDSFEGFASVHRTLNGLAPVKANGRRPPYARWQSEPVPCSGGDFEDSQNHAVSTRKPHRSPPSLRLLRSPT
eukprot:CAMPEP_0114111630 /NCGR_PEP_ID=MMETSP0043_2-20121206/1957_1 /TAXON_ID=464988 /ORGANISM="Hemiselmis andersenii, Strain CCMP644" /LENGTH=132 /DNA_ID=CAMNT_0001203677 /DNA_START=904 /DNA_END=1299 /DNA_ORIENTATION=-